MGTTLTGTTPQDTYDSLIKVTDNGPLSGSLKKLTDGLGNDSALSLSTGAASVTGTLAVSSNGLFGGSTNAGNAGTNTISVGVAGTSTGGLQLWAGSAQTHYVQFGDGTTGAQPYAGYVGYNHTADSLIFGSASADRLTITSAGNVGIGTSSPTGKLTVSQANSGGVAAILLTEDESTIQGPSANTYLKMGGNMTFGAAGVIPIQIATTEVLRVTSNGLTFNGDTAAANALDDYEEGTWTMGVSFGGASTGVTYALNLGTYTKIGRQVTVNGYVELSSKGSSTGDAVITGLPFTIANTTANFSAASLWLFNVTFANQFTALGVQNTTQISLREITEAGTQSNLTNADFANNSHVIVSLTYFV